MPCGVLVPTNAPSTLLLPQPRSQARPGTFDHGRMDAVYLLICQRAIFRPVSTSQRNTLPPRLDPLPLVNIEDLDALQQWRRDRLHSLDHCGGGKLAFENQCHVASDRGKTRRYLDRFARRET